MNKARFLTLLSVVILLTICMNANAQPFPPDPVAAPLDGFTFLLIAGGAAAAATQLKDKD